jgi:hypothetical protein
MEFRDVLVNLDSPQQGEEVGASQFTQAPPVWTHPTQPQGGATPAADGATRADGATPAAGERHRRVAGSLQAAMAWSPGQLGPRVVRAPDP